MKKTFLNVALLSLLTMSASSVFTACSDDEWKDGVNKVEGEVNATSDLIKQMDAQIKALDAALKQAQSDADAAKQAADAALEAAKKAAEEGNQELAALKAEVAENKLAAEAAATAQAEALEALKTQLEALKVLVETNSQLIEENKNAIGGINAKLEGNTESINQLLGDVDNINSVIAQLKNQLGDINVADLKTTLDNLSGTVTGLQTAITTIQGQIAAIDAKLATIDMDAINAKFGTLETNLANEIADRQAADAALQQQIDELRTQLEALNLGTNLAEFAEFVEATETQLAALEEFKTDALERLSVLEGKVEGIETILSDYEERISTLESELVTLKSDVAANKKEIGDLKKELENLASRISAINDNLCTLLYGELRSLVFVPQAYVNGIESALYYYMNYNALVGDTKSQADRVMTINDTKYVVLSEKQMWNFVEDKDELTVNPYCTVQYNMNPTSANAPYEALSFVSNDTEIISRTSKANIVTDEEGYKVENGVLSIGLKADASKIDEESGKMPVFALRANVATVGPEGEEKTVVVTSDYAMLQPMNVVPSCLAYNKEDIPGLMPSRVPGGAELYADLVNTFGHVPSIEVPWDNNKTTLSDYIKIVYQDEKTGAFRTWTKAEEWEHFGLSLLFEPIEYTIGGATNAVSESAWCTVDAQTGLFKPCGVTNDGKPSGQNDRNSIGKQPLVRVTVMESGNIVLVGYIKVKIVPAVKYYVTDAFKFDAVDFSCETQSAGIPNGNILAEILETTGYSEDKFFDNYHWAIKGPENLFLTQYVYDAGAKNYKVASVDNSIGEFVGSSLATLSVESNRQINLEWGLDVVEQQKMYMYPNHVGSTVVCFESDNADIFPPIYIPVTGSINAKATGTVGSKMEARWFRDQSTALLNVQQPTDGFQPTTITADLDQLWQVSKDTQKNQPVISWKSGAPKFVSALYAQEYGVNGGYKYYFTAENNRPLNGTTSEGKPYRVQLSVEKKTAMSLLGNDVSASNMGDNALMVDLNGMDTKYGEYENTILYADGKELAEINPETGEITLADNATARTLLNMFASDGNGIDRTNAMLEAKIGIVAYNGCGIALKLDDTSVFPAVFLRPINIDKDKVGIFTDATANGSLVDVFSLLSFSDWRGVDFTDENGWLFAYYNVMSAVPDFSRMTTNAATVATNPGNFTVEPTITAAFTLVEDAEIDFEPSDAVEGNSYYILDTVREGFGKIKYDNTKVNVNSFKVRIPFTITYGMGEFEIWIECDVESTMGAGA